MALGNRAHLSGLNIVGLQRRGFSRDDIHDLRRAYRLLFAAEGTLSERIEDVAAGVRRPSPRCRKSSRSSARAASARCARRRTAKRAETAHGRADRGASGSSLAPARFRSKSPRSVVRRGGAVHIVMVDGGPIAALETLSTYGRQLGAARPRDGGAQACRHPRHRSCSAAVRAPRSSAMRGPTLAFFRELPRVLRLLKAGGDDAVLRGVLARVRRQGFTVVGVDEVAPELLVGDGNLTKASASRRKRRRHRARLRSRRRARPLRYRPGGGRQPRPHRGDRRRRRHRPHAEARRRSARKRAATANATAFSSSVPKPGQDLRVDLPAIGPNTVAQRRQQPGFAASPCMADHVLAADRSQMIARADRATAVRRRVSEAEERAAAPARSPDIRSTPWAIFRSTPAAEARYRASRRRSCRRCSVRRRLGCRHRRRTRSRGRRRGRAGIAVVERVRTLARKKYAPPRRPGRSDADYRLDELCIAAARRRSPDRRIAMHGRTARQSLTNNLPLVIPLANRSAMFVARLSVRRPAMALERDQSR